MEKIISINFRRTSKKKNSFINSLNLFDIIYIIIFILVNIVIFFAFPKSKKNVNNINKTKNNYVPIKLEDIKIGTQKKEIKEKFKKEIDFLQSCLVGINNITYEKPSLSLVIPYFDEGEYLERLIRSIQRQEFKEVEMIIIDDHSQDKKSIKFLKEQSELDKRIKIIKNKKYKGTLYSYVIGILEAKGSHIMLLKPGDMLLSNLKGLYEIAKKNEKDINDFSYIGGAISNIDSQRIMKDLEKYNESIVEMVFSNSYTNLNLNNKILKTDFLKNAVSTLKEEYLKLNIEQNVNNFLIICFFSNAKSYQSFSELFSFFSINNPINHRSIYKKENHNDFYKSSLYLLEYISELKYSSKDIYNRRIRYGRIILSISLLECKDRKLKVDWKKLDKVLISILNNKDLTSHNKFRLNEIKQRSIKQSKVVE